MPPRPGRTRTPPRSTRAPRPRSVSSGPDDRESREYRDTRSALALARKSFLAVHAPKRSEACTSSPECAKTSSAQCRGRAGACEAGQQALSAAQQALSLPAAAAPSCWQARVALEEIAAQGAACDRSEAAASATPGGKGRVPRAAPLLFSFLGPRLRRDTRTPPRPQRTSRYSRRLKCSFPRALASAARALASSASAAAAASPSPGCAPSSRAACAACAACAADPPSSAPAAAASPPSSPMTTCTSAASAPCASTASPRSTLTYDEESSEASDSERSEPLEDAPRFSGIGAAAAQSIRAGDPTPCECRSARAWRGRPGGREPPAR